MNPTPILHHYAFSPFSEKVRISFGLKGVPWRSVDIPGLPPRPLLSPLTGGYRRVPVLQIGADIFCDTNLILPALDRVFPGNPSLYPADGHGSKGLAQGLAFAWERQTWIPTIGVLVHYIGEHISPEFIKDRKEGYLGIDISKSAMAPQLDQHVQFLRAQYAWLRHALEGRHYLLSDTPSAADLACWQTTWLLRKNCPPEVDDLLGLAPLAPWYDRIVALGHDSSTPMTSEEAFEIARASTPAPVDHIGPNSDPGGLKPGDRVQVTPDDNARIAVQGDLVAASEDEVIIHLRDPQAGDLHVHFPRLGFEVFTV